MGREAMIEKILKGVARFLPQSFNDLLCLLFLSMTSFLWVVQGRGLITLKDDVNGALTVLVTLVIQYYFRKAKTEV
jgi:hypothetical protein